MAKESLVKTVDTKKKSAWLGARLANVNSTEVAAIFGASPYETKLSLWHRKNTHGAHYLEDGPFTPNERSDIGKIMERSIADAAKKLLGWKMHKDYDYKYHETMGVGASYDYTIDTGKVGNVNVDNWGCEIKSIDYSIWKNQWFVADEGGEDSFIEPPIHIEFQGQQQRWLDKRPGTVFLCLVGGNHLETVLQPTNHKIGDALVLAIEDFCVTKEAPQPDFNRDAALIRKLYGDLKDRDSVLDARDGHFTERLREVGHYWEWACKESSAWEARKQALSTEFLSLAGDYGKVLLPDLRTVTLSKVAGKAPNVITEDMVGQEIGGRKSYRLTRINYPKHRAKKGEGTNGDE